MADKSARRNSAFNHFRRHAGQLLWRQRPRPYGVFQHVSILMFNSGIGFAFQLSLPAMLQCNNESYAIVGEMTTM